MCSPALFLLLERRGRRSKHSSSNSGSNSSSSVTRLPFALLSSKKPATQLELFSPFSSFPLSPFPLSFCTALFFDPLARLCLRARELEEHCLRTRCSRLLPLAATHILEILGRLSSSYHNFVFFFHPYFSTSSRPLVLSTSLPQLDPQKTSKNTSALCARRSPASSSPSTATSASPTAAASRRRTSPRCARQGSWCSSTLPRRSTSPNTSTT